MGGEAVELLLGGHLGEEGVHGDRGGDSIDADAVFCRLERRAAGEGHDARLGRGVVGLALLGAPAEHGGVVDDRARALGVEEGQEGAGHPHDAGQGDVQDAGPLIVGHLDDRDLAAEAGVVDQDVDGSEAVAGGVAQGIDVLLARHVADEGLRPGSGRGLDPVGGLAETALVEVADQQAGAFLGGAQGGGIADPRAGGGGHHDALVPEQVSGGGIGRGEGHAGSGILASRPIRPARTSR